MSSSNVAKNAAPAAAEAGEKQTRITGRVFLGAGMSRDSLVAVEDIAGIGSAKRWSKEVEQEVMQRVQEKAAAKAKEIVSNATVEAKRIREGAYQEGLEQGLAEAQQQLEQAHIEMSESLAGALEAINSGRESIWKTHRQDLVALVRLAVERICNLELDQNRREVLSGFLDQAVESLDELSGLNITVHPDDRETIEQLLAASSQRHPKLSAWRVKDDPKMQPGGLLVESDHGMVDNTLEGRLAIVKPILDSLSLEPEDSCEGNCETPGDGA